MNFLPFLPLRTCARNAAVCVLAATAALASHAQSTPAIKEGLTIAFLPKQINNPYNVITGLGVEMAAKEIKAISKTVGPSDAGASSQVSYINTLVTQKQSAIIISANDPNALVPYLKKAQAQGTKVVAVDSDVTDGRALFINQANSEGIGRSQMQLLAKLMAGKGEFAILSATPNAANQNTWIRWMQEELKKPDYKDMRLVKTTMTGMFVHLRLHTEFSVVDGTNRIDEIVKAAQADAQPALGITDLNNAVRRHQVLQGGARAPA
jgi:rhamnose transport system substrate-binding protein